MVANVINYIYHLLMGRILGPVDYGTLVSVYSVLYIVSIIPSSASISIVKFISSAQDKEERNEIYKSINIFIVRLAGLLAVVVALLSPTISKFLNISNNSIVLLVAPILFLSLVTLVNMSTMQGVLKFTGVIVPSIISAASKLVFGLVLIWLGYSVLGAIWAIVIGAAIAYLISRKMIVGEIDTRNSQGNYPLKSFYKYSLPVLIQALAFTSLFTVDVILVKHFLSPFDAGLYAALSTLGKIIFFASSPIAATMFPIVSKRKANNQGYNKVFLTSLIVTLAVGIAITSFYWLFPSVAIGVLYGPAYLSAKSALVWMGILILFYSLSSLMVNFSLSLGESRAVYFPLIAAVLQAPLIWFFHGSILEVIQISLGLVAAMFIFLSFYLGYNHFK